MKIYQLFKEKIPEDIFQELLLIFNIRDINDISHCFSKQDLLNSDIISKIENIKHKIYPYYLPCKARVYLEEIDVNKCITIFRQILKLYQMKLESKQKYVKYKKTTVYFVSKSNTSSSTHMKVDNNAALLDFA